jgi:PAS domain S-box-containing protein
LLEDSRNLDEKILSELIAARARIKELEASEIATRKELQLSEQRMSLHFQETPLGVIEWNLDFRVVRWNRAAESIFGYTLEEALGRHATELILAETTIPQVDIVWNNLLSRKGGHRSRNGNTTKDGRLILCEWYNTLLIAQDETVIGVASFVQDITDTARAEKVREAIFKISQAAVSTDTLMELYRSIHSTLGDLMPVDNFYIALFDPGHDLLSFPYYIDQYDPPFPPQKLGRGLTEYVLRTARPLLATQEVFNHLIEEGEVELEGADSLAWLGVPLKVEERLIGVMVTQSYTENIHYSQADLDMLEFVSSQIAQAIARKTDEEQIRQNVIRTQGMIEISTGIFESGLDTQAVLDNIACLVSKLIGDACTLCLTAEDGENLVVMSFCHAKPCDATLIREKFAAGRFRLGEGLAGQVASSAEPLRLEDVTDDEIQKAIQVEYSAYQEFFEIHSVLIVPLRTQGQVIGTLSITRDTPGRPYSENDQVFLQDAADRSALAIINASLYAQEHVRGKELSILYSLSSALRKTLQESEMLAVVLKEVRQFFNTDSGMIALIDYSKAHFTIAQAIGALTVNTGRIFPLEEGVLGLVLQSGRPYVTQNFAGETLHLAGLDNIESLGPAIFVPLLSDAELQGILLIARNKKNQASSYNAKEVQLLAAIGEMVGTSLRRTHLFEDANRRLKQTQSLRAIDTAISNSHDLRVTLDIFLDQVVEQLNVDAVCVLLLDNGQELSYAAGRGFNTTTLQHTRLKLGEGYAGMAAKERRIINIPDLRIRHTDFLRSPTFGAEKFVSYYAIPLATQAQVTGVLEIYHRAPLNPNPEWFEFAQTMAGQAAIAIDNATLFSELEHSNFELLQAYEATIEGWSRALDLRDHETEGHTQRVTKLTIQMAQKLGLNNDQISQISRGALLHDIGKMGIPDDILLKPGPLTAEEWEEMRKHPIYARDLLTSITYLEPAIDIPYCHHEKWNGTGYPRGLREEEIPMAARIFSIVDVWDALTSDRPYRAAWPKKKTLEYISSQAGKHFDPNIFAIFNKLIYEIED